MTRNLELPENVLEALQRAASAAGQTPSDWIAAHLPVEEHAILPDTTERRAKTLADLFEGRTGKVRSGGGEALSETCGAKFAEHLEAKRAANRL